MPTGENVYKLKIDAEFKRFIPPLLPEERKQLEENIINDGCREPLCVWNKTIIDGHNRYEICTQHQIPFAITYIFLKSREEAIAWICANQLGRRNITEETRRYLIGKRYELEKMIGAHNAVGTNQFVRKEVSSQIANEPKFDDTALRTGERLGKEYRVDPATIVRYGVYAQALDMLSKTVPEIHEKITSGRLKISQDNIIKLSRLSPPEIRRAISKLLENPHDYINYAKTRDVLPLKHTAPAPLPQVQIGAIKDMPEYDPDAEILSLALTIPSWVSSVNRVRTCAKFEEISDNARKKLRVELGELNSVINMMLSAIEEDT